MSVTFQDEKVNSKATSEYGWRVTPYAYLLLEGARPEGRQGPAACGSTSTSWTRRATWSCRSNRRRFRSTPRPAKGAVRPFEKLQITQTLDERQAGDGKLIVEIKAVARGLVPDLDEILALDQPGFEREKIDDQGVSVSKFDQDSEATVIDSERTWLVTYRAAAGPDQAAEHVPIRRGQGRRRRDGLSALRRRRPGQGRAGGLAAGAVRAGAVCLALVGRRRASAGLAFAVVAIRILRSGPKRLAATRFRMPELVTPFSVLGLLREIQHNNGLPAPEMQELAGSIEAHRATLLRRVRRRTGRPRAGRRDLDPPGVVSVASRDRLSIIARRSHKLSSAHGMYSHERSPPRCKPGRTGFR